MLSMKYKYINENYHYRSNILSELGKFARLKSDSTRIL